MLKAKAQLNLANAREYFREHLAIGDYYASERIAGEWFGEGAARLGLKERVEESAFIALCEGRNPADHKLTVRRKTVRREVGGSRANRRICYWASFHETRYAITAR